MNKNLASISLEEQQYQLDARKNLTFFNGDYLDAYNFSFRLFESLWLDGFEVEHPVNVLNLLLSFTTEQHVQQSKVREISINNMTQDMYVMYPEGKTIIIHSAALLHSIHDFISALGEHTLKIQRRECDILYSWWIKREHIYTYTYLDAFFKDYTKLLSGIDNFKSILMNMHISRHVTDEDFCAFDTILAKEDRYKKIDERITNAIAMNFYLEAISLEESCISDKLSLALYMKGRKAGSKTFATLIKGCGDFLPEDLKQEIDLWRKKRNQSIHNLVRSSPLEELTELERLDELTNDTAQYGYDLLCSVNQWFEEFILAEMNPFYFRLMEDDDLQG